VTALADGRFAVIYQDTAGGQQARVRIFEADGTPVIPAVIGSDSRGISKSVAT
jgi:hypothetical protein